MMFKEITTTLNAVAMSASREDYRNEIVLSNILGKNTFSTREKSFRHLREHYGLDPSLPLFYVFRFFASESPESLPLLALVLAFCRDPQLRISFDLIDAATVGQECSSKSFEEHLESIYPGRFSKSTNASMARNLRSTWTTTGHLIGRRHKIRQNPVSSVAATTFAAFAGYLLGLRGDVLLKSVLLRLVATDHSTTVSHLSSASSQGWLRFLSSGGVTEVDFEPLIRRYQLEVPLGSS
jgi:hypothetical protein